ncbi:hypothetical protein J6590_041515 [Homalodisca vitripennis]|nr:hypothetical protein J6590_041515 [Homalodisca vitripennis]
MDVDGGVGVLLGARAARSRGPGGLGPSGALPYEGYNHYTQSCSWSDRAFCLARIHLYPSNSPGLEGIVGGGELNPGAPSALAPQCTVTSSG